MGSPSKKMKLDYPGFNNEAFPHVFDINAMPKQPKVLKDGQLSAEQVKHYFEKVHI